MGKKSWRLIMTSLLAFVLLFLLLGTILEADHDCHGHDCAVCAQLQACVELLRQFTLAPTLILPALTLQSVLAVLHRGRACTYRHISPITLKVKLSD